MPDEPERGVVGSAGDRGLGWALPARFEVGQPVVESGSRAREPMANAGSTGNPLRLDRRGSAMDSCGIAETIGGGHRDGSRARRP